MSELDPTVLDHRLRGDLEALAGFRDEFSRLGRPLPERLNADQTNVEHGLAKLVLTLIEFVRQLLERQAIRRIEAETLTEEEIERMGETFLKLERKMDELKIVFGLQDEDLNLHLGPLGDLL